MPGTGKGRFKTAPSLATIQEDDVDDQRDASLSPLQESREGEGEAADQVLDSELIKNSTKSSVKQMRVPKIKGKAAATTISADESILKSLEDPLVMPSTAQKYTTISQLPSPLKNASLKLPESDEEIMFAGTAFLDSIGQSFGGVE